MWVNVPTNCKALDHIENLDTTSLEQQEAYKIRIQALLEDLQLRDDTIAGLEHD